MNASSPRSSSDPGLRTTANSLVESACTSPSSSSSVTACFSGTGTGIAVGATTTGATGATTGGVTGVSTFFSSVFPLISSWTC